jgi:hypothetical protein
MPESVGRPPAKSAAMNAQAMAEEVSERLNCTVMTCARLITTNYRAAFADSRNRRSFWNDRLAQLPQLERENKFFAGMGFGNT